MDRRSGHRSWPRDFAVVGGSGSDGSVIHLKRRMPVSRAIRWSPRQAESRGPADAGAATAYELFVTQRALRQLRDQQRAGSRSGAFGFLYGELFECTKSALRYSVVDATVAASSRFDESRQEAVLDREWPTVQKWSEKLGLAVAGWYHTHPHLGVVLSEADAGTHVQWFREPWQTALVFARRGRDWDAGFFRYTTRGGLSRVHPAAFFELLDRLPEAGSAKVTYVDWEGYITDESVVPPAEDVVESVVEAEAVIESAESVMEEERIDPPPEEQEAFEERDIDRDEVAASEAEERLRDVLGEFAHDRDSEITLVLAKKDGASPFDLDAILRRVRWPWILGLAVVLLAGWLMVNALRRPPEPRPLPPSPAPTRPVSPAVAEFDGAARDLSRAIAGYAERRNDFDLGRIDCSGLAAGYRIADEALVTVSQRFVAARAELGARQAEMYDELVSRMDTVNQHFDSTGCARPE